MIILFILRNLTCKHQIQWIISSNFLASLTFLKNLNFTAKKMQDRFIVSSIKPKIDNQFFVSYIVYVLCTNCEREIVFDDLQNWQNDFSFTTNQRKIGCQILASLKKL